jgi:hypothetical protein
VTTNAISQPAAVIGSGVDILVVKPRLLFKPFRQSDEDTRRRYGSTGLRNSLQVTADRRLWEKSTLSKLPIIHVVGTTTPDAHGLCLAAGLDTSLSKLFTVGVLYAAIDRRASHLATGTAFAHQLNVKLLVTQQMARDFAAESVAVPKKRWLFCQHSKV